MPVAFSCVVVPRAMAGLTGDTSIETRVMEGAGGVVPPLPPGSVAAAGLLPPPPPPHPAIITKSKIEDRRILVFFIQKSFPEKIFLLDIQLGKFRALRLNSFSFLIQK